jgi:acyl carrier protein
MTRNPVDAATLRQLVLDMLCRIAPGFSPEALHPKEPLRNQVDFDSMDWLNFLVAVREKLGVDIPEADYAKVVTLDGLLAYLSRKL